MKKILMSLLCLVMVITLTGCGNNKKNETKKENKNVEDKLATIAFDDQIIDNLTFENFAITPDGKDQIVFFSITNNTNSNVNVGTITFTLYSEKAEVISLPEVINKTLVSGESVDITETFDVNLSNVDEVEYKIN